MDQQLPLYQVGDAYVEAFMITHIDVLDAGVVLWGANGVRTAVGRSWVDHRQPQVGGYYVCFTDGVETFVKADDFNANFLPAG